MQFLSLAIRITFLRSRKYCLPPIKKVLASAGRQQLVALLRVLFQPLIFPTQQTPRLEQFDFVSHNMDYENETQLGEDMLGVM